MLVQFYKIIRLVIIIFTSSYFLGILWHIFVVDIQGTEWIDENDHSLGPVVINFDTEKMNVESDTGIDKLVKVWYFAITTLSTIGYGDFHPVSIMERVVALAILLFGVSVFSFIMG